MAGNKVRWAILGAGRIAHKFAQDFASVKNAELVAVASRDITRAKEFAEPYNISNVFDYNELYNSREVDAVYIATPHNFHFNQSLECIQHNKAVLCEKPVTINDREFKTLAKLALDKQVFLMEAMWTYFLPAMQKAKEWITEGRIGNIKMIRADFGYQMQMDATSRLYDAKLAGGALLDLGIYPIAFSTYFMNCKPGTIDASAIVGSTQVDESTGMIFNYGDAIAMLDCTILNHTTIQGCIFGEEGFIEIPHFYNAKAANLFNNQHELVESFVDDRATLGYNYEIQEATDCILNGSTQSKVVPHEVSNILQEIMTEVRKKIGVQYPMETLE